VQVTQISFTDTGKTAHCYKTWIF